MRTLTRDQILHAKSIAIRIHGPTLIELLERTDPDGTMVVIREATEQPDGTFDLAIMQVKPGAGPDYPTQPAAHEVAVTDWRELARQFRETGVVPYHPFLPGSGDGKTCNFAPCYKERDHERHHPPDFVTINRKLAEKITTA